MFSFQNKEDLSKLTDIHDITIYYLLYLLLVHKVKESEVTQSCLTPCDPMDCSPSDSSIHGISQQKYCSGLPFPSPRDLPKPGMEHRSPTL